MFRLLSLLLVLSTVPSYGLLTKMHFSGAIYCNWDAPERKPDDDFILDIKVMEEDCWFWDWFDDDITVPGSFKVWSNFTKDGDHNKEKKYMYYTIEAEDTGDGIGEDYEIYFLVKHNCNALGTVFTRHQEVIQAIRTDEGDVWRNVNFYVSLNDGKKRNVEENRIGFQRQLE